MWTSVSSDRALNAGRATQPLEDGIMMYMPGGLHQITPSQNGRAVTVIVEVNAKSADLLEAQRKILTAANKKPFFSVEHATGIAAFWPTSFFWDKRIDATGSLVEGVWTKGEWTKAGREAVEGKNFRTFSPTFFVDAIRNDPDNPVQVICCDDAKANCGALENDPAFQAMSPLWCKNAATPHKQSTPGRAGNAGAPGSQQTNKGNKMTKEKIAELQARNTDLEFTINGLNGKDDATSRASLQAARNERDLNLSLLEGANKDEEIAALKASRQADVERNAETAVQRMVAGKGTITIPARDLELQASYKEKFIKDPTLIPLLAGSGGSDTGYQPGQFGGGALSAPERRMAPGAAALDASGQQRQHRYEGGWDMAGAMKHYWNLVAANANVSIKGGDGRHDAYRRKGRFALQAANFYKTELAPNLDKWQDCFIEELGERVGIVGPQNSDGAITRIEASAAQRQGVYLLKAADYTDNNDPTNVLGVLSGTLVLQRTLPNFKYKYPELMSMTTDFSDTPGLYKQTETTRYVTQPAVQLYNPATDGTGRPLGWNTVSPATTTDVSMTLTDYIAVPINIGNNLLGATTRRLFDEQSELAIAAIAGYFTNMVTNLFTAANYNSFANANGGTVPTAYPTYAKGLQDFGFNDLNLLDAAFTSIKAPEDDRTILLNPQYYAKLRNDPLMAYYFMGSGGRDAAGAGGWVTEAKLPKLSGFAPYKAGYMPASAPSTVPTQQNICGFAFQKAAIILKSRLPQDFTQALGVMIPGSVTTITDPDTKISIMLVQYVSLQGGWAEWRPEVMLGVAKGDPRGGLVMTTQ